MEPLKIIPLGGLGEFGFNMMLIEYGDAAIAIDCGLMFPERRSVGHRLGDPRCQLFAGTATTSSKRSCSPTPMRTMSAPCPLFSKHFDVPIYGTRLTLGLLANKLREHDLEDTADIREITAGAPWEIAPFRIEGIRVTHSLMDCLALAIETPIGTVIHTGDFKIDNTPMEGEMFDFQRFAAYGEKGVLLLLSDSTNVERAGLHAVGARSRHQSRTDHSVRAPAKSWSRPFHRASRESSRSSISPSAATGASC